MTLVAKPAVVRNTIVFWLLLLAMAFGQQRRDPTQPSAAIQQRLSASTIVPTSGAADNPLGPIKVKAIVLGDRDHGTALLETAQGTIKIRLHRDAPIEITIDRIRYIVKDFSASGVQLEPLRP